MAFKDTIDKVVFGPSGNFWVTSTKFHNPCFFFPFDQALKVSSVLLLILRYFFIILIYHIYGPAGPQTVQQLLNFLRS